MEVKDLKEKLHTLIEQSSEETLEYVYALLEQAAYTDEFKAVLDEEYKEYRKDKTGDARKDIDVMISGLLNE